MIMDVLRALGLERPVVMGCSIGGRIVLDLALKHARELRALIGLQTGAYVERYYDASWLDHPEVHGGRACGAVAYGLMSPLSPEKERWETVWHYMQGGPACSPATCTSIRSTATSATASARSTPASARSTCLTGEYDYSASPRDTEAAVARVTGARMTVMKGLGHFPMSENPQAFLGYLRPVLKEIRT